MPNFNYLAIPDVEESAANSQSTIGNFCVSKLKLSAPMSLPYS